MSQGTVRPFAAADRERVNALARAAFAEYAGAYEDWPSFIEGIGRMASLTALSWVLWFTSVPGGRAVRSFPMTGG